MFTKNKTKQKGKNNIKISKDQPSNKKMNKK